ncbi:hypothetical protein AHAS_Ahas07G0177500 [Arachis hypogaea]
MKRVLPKDPAITRKMDLALYCTMVLYVLSVSLIPKFQFCNTQWAVTSSFVLSVNDADDDFAQYVYS